MKKADRLKVLNSRKINNYAKSFLKGIESRSVRVTKAHCYGEETNMQTSYKQYQHCI